MGAEIEFELLPSGCIKIRLADSDYADAIVELLSLLQVSNEELEKVKRFFSQSSGTELIVGSNLCG